MMMGDVAITSVRFTGRTRDKAMDTKRLVQLLPDVTLDRPVAGIDLGGNGLKALVVLPGHGLFKFKFPLLNGSSIGQHQRLTKTALAVLETVVTGLKYSLKKMDVPKRNMEAVATAGVRDAKNGQATLETIQDLGIPCRMIDASEESALIYPSVLVGEGIGPEEKVLVVEIGGGSTELAFGTGPEPETLDRDVVLPLGTGRLNIKKPFDYKYLRRVRGKVKKAVQAEVDDSVKALAKERRLFIKQRSWDDLREVHLERMQGDTDALTGEALPHLEEGTTDDKVHDLYYQPITTQMLDAYLSKQGLVFLETQLAERSPLEHSKLIAKMIVMRELMGHLEMDDMELGFRGGLKFQLLKQAMLKASSS